MIYQINSDPQYFFRMSVKALILDEQKKFLLLQETDGSWSLPWWWLAQGDDCATSLKIKITKELWVEPSRVAKNPSYFITALDDYGQNVRKWNIVYEVKLPHTDFQLGKDEIAYGFFSSEEALKQKLTTNTIAFIKEFNDYD